MQSLLETERHSHSVVRLREAHRAVLEIGAHESAGLAQSRNRLRRGGIDLPDYPTLSILNSQIKNHIKDKIKYTIKYLRLKLKTL